MQSCPTGIDIPLFIRQIAKDNAIGAAETILEANIMGGMCARVCPTEQLCEEACVREHAEGKPVKIGALQRHATDAIMAASASTGHHPFNRAPDSGFSVAVVGAGPAGLSAAHRLALLGHAVTLYDAKPKLGGLNEYGIAAYKTPADFAQAEVDFILGIGGITVASGRRLGVDIDLETLRGRHDAVFLGLGLGGVNALAGMEAQSNVIDALGFIEILRQAPDKATVPGRPAGRRNRRRHDGGRRRRPGAPSRRRRGDHRLPPRPRRHEGQPLGTGTGTDQWGRDPPLDGAGPASRRATALWRRCVSPIGPRPERAPSSPRT